MRTVVAWMLFRGSLAAIAMSTGSDGRLTEIGIAESAPFPDTAGNGPLICPLYLQTIAGYGAQ
jgi:hypothetical protein